MSHHEETFNVVKQAELHRIPRSRCHGSMTQFIIAYRDDSCLCLKGQSVQDWGQSVQSPTLEKDVVREECNVMLQCGDNTSSVSFDEGLTASSVRHSGLKLHR
jgi:hypothetical protein